MSNWSINIQNVYGGLFNFSHLIHVSSLLNNILIFKQININNRQCILYTLSWW
jgi:hypothetical protein